MPTFYAVGNTIIDIFIKVAKLPKNMTIDKPTFFKQEQLTALVKELTINGKNTITRTTGGVATNIIKTTAKLGSRSFYSSSIANDENGQFFENEMKKLGVFCFLDYKKQNTGQYLTIVGPADKDGKPVCAPAYTFSEDDKITSALLRIPYLINSDAVIMEGITIYNTELWDKVFSTCADCKKPLVIALIAPPDILSLVADYVIKYIDKIPMILAANKRESDCFQEILKSKGYSYQKFIENSDPSISPLFLELRNEQGSAAWFENSFIEIPLPKTQVTDYTGSGEAFIGAFITRWFSISNQLHDKRKNSKTLSECLTFANEKMLQALTSYGCNI